MHPNKNKFLFFHMTMIFLAFSNYTCMAMNPQMTEQEMKDAIATAKDRADKQDLELQSAQQNIADEKQKNTNLEEGLKKQKEKNKAAEDEIKFMKRYPQIQAGKIEQISQDPSVATAQVKKLEAEKKLVDSQHGWPQRISHTADQVFWPIVREQASFATTELRKKVYSTTIELQNEKMGKLKLISEKSVLSVNDLDMATKLFALDQTKRSYEVSESLADAQFLGQTLANIQLLSADQSSKNEKQAKRIDALIAETVDLQERQLMKFSAKIKAQQISPSEHSRVASKLIEDIIAKKKRQEDKKEQKKIEKQLKEKELKEKQERLRNSLSRNE